MYIFLGILISVLGIAMICRPRQIYDLTEAWKHDGQSSPSDLYLLNIRIGGCFFAVVGIVCTVILIFFQ